MAQSCKQGLRKYKSTYHALSTILKEEYSQNMLGIYLSTSLLIPCLLQHSIEPLLELITPVLTDRLFHSKKASSLSVVLLDFTISTLDLLIVTPIETIRKRLQCQAILKTPMEGTRDFNTVVECSFLPPNLPYSSPLDCAWRILMVESGIGGLYRGFKAKLAFTFSVALLQLLSRYASLDQDW